MKNRNLLGLAALLLLLAFVFGGSLLCQPASERDEISPEADRWREQPASAPGGAQLEPQREAAANPTATLVQDLRARVVDQDGRPIFGAEVFLNWADKPGAAPAARAFSDLDGVVRFERLPRARYRLHAAADGYFPSVTQAEATVPAAEAEILLPLERGGVVSGFVHGMDGIELPFAWIRLRDLDSGATVLTRADERRAFQSGALRRGAWEVAWVEHEQAEPDPRVVWSALIEPGNHVELLVTVDQTTRGEPREDRKPGIELFQRGG